MAISIITAIHNGLPMNRLFWKALSAGTTVPFELILVDNHSTDGSETFFRGLSESSSAARKVVYLRNETNQTYPASQNQGLRHATSEVLVFMNNDVWVPRGWHVAIEAALADEPYLVVSPSGQEAQPRQGLSRALKGKWKRAVWLSRAWQRLTGADEEARLWKALTWMYGDLDSFVSPTPGGSPGWFPGIKGDTVAFRRALAARLPEIWDERIQAADWHLYLTLARLHAERPTEFPLPRILQNSYVHHFGRYSAKLKYEPIPNEPKYLTMEEVWGREAIDRLWWGNHLPA